MWPTGLAHDEPPSHKVGSIVVGNTPHIDRAIDGKLGHKAGEAKVTSTSGAIDRVVLTSVTEGGDEPGTFTLNAEDLVLRIAQWDVDGDTRYEDNPHYPYLSTGGATTGRITIDAQLLDDRATLTKADVWGPLTSAYTFAKGREWGKC